MPTVSTDADAYQSLDRIRQRVDFEADDFFDDNAALRFDELLVELEAEARGIFETLWGDETPLTETDRVQEIRTTDDSALALVYPIQSVSKVERKISLSSDWEEVDPEWYDWTNHRLVLARRPNTRTLRQQQHSNPLTRYAERVTWQDYAAVLRVTYDRGFGSEPPTDIQNIQIQMIANALRKRKQDETISAASPEELSNAMGTSEMLTDDLRQRIDDVTTPGMATLSV